MDRLAGAMSGEASPEKMETEEPVVRPRRKGALWLWLGGVLLIAGGVALCLGWQQVRWRTDMGRTEAHRTAVTLQTAVEAYQADYEHLPSVASGSGRIDTTTADGIELINVLMGREPESAEPRNPDRIPFLALKEGKEKKDGLMYDVRSKVAGLYDPWGGPYQILLDMNGDGSIAGPKGSPPIQGRVGVYSAGPDHETGTWDDVRSW